MISTNLRSVIYVRSEKKMTGWSVAVLAIAAHLLSPTPSTILHAVGSSP
jgi:hypothetical protein